MAALTLLAACGDDGGGVTGLGRSATSTAVNTTAPATASTTATTASPVDASTVPVAPPAPSGGTAPTSAVPGTSAPPASAAGSTSTAANRPPAWRPAPHTSWQWQLSGALDLSVDAAIYDIDLFETSAATVKQLHDMGRRVVCYVSVGSLENGRPDTSRFPSAVVGAQLEGWPDERWLDIRRLDVLLPIMGDRFDQCRAKGFDGVEPDNVDAYSNRSGFPLTAADQIRFNQAIAKLAHDRGLSVALKNDVEQAAALEPAFDFALNEECVQYDECGALRPFTQAGKAVLHVEYEVSLNEMCSTTAPLGFSSMRKHLELDAWREPCP